jgi:hypothetical protein
MEKLKEIQSQLEDLALKHIDRLNAGELEMEFKTFSIVQNIIGVVLAIEHETKSK